MPEAFDVPASGADIFRIFVVPIPADAPRYVKAIEFVPGTRVVHHANIRLDETRMSRQLDESDPRPGYDGLLARTAHFPDGYFFGWTPGQLSTGSDDFAWRLNPGTDMVLQLHLRPTGRPEHVQASIGLYFASGPPRLTPVMLRLGKQDIEIPSGQRDYVATRLVRPAGRRRGPRRAAARPLSRPRRHRLCHASQPDHKGSDSHPGLGLRLAGHLPVR